MKFETALTLNDLNTKLNDLLTKCQQKKNETNHKIEQIKIEIQIRASNLLNNLTGQQVELLFDSNEAEFYFETKLNYIKSEQQSIELKLNKKNEIKTLKSQLIEQINDLKVIEFRTSTINKLKIGEITPVMQVIIPFYP